MPRDLEACAPTPGQGGQFQGAPVSAYPVGGLDPGLVAWLGSVGVLHLHGPSDSAANPSPGRLFAPPAIVRFGLLPMNLFPAARPEGLRAQIRRGHLLSAFLFAPPLIWAFLWVALGVTAMLALAYWAASRLRCGLTGDI